jgi:glycine dehydrogenase
MNPVFTDIKNDFIARHIGPSTDEQNVMLQTLGFSTLEEMASKVIPKNIRTNSAYQNAEARSEFEWISHMKSIFGKNQIFRSYIGLGFHDCITPTVIARNILENPVWYTAYTPYQAEIAQGRLEALLNFQTMVSDLTGMDISNSSLLDEGSAAAEAVGMAHNLTKNKSTVFVAAQELHPHVLEVLKTRTEPLGLQMKVMPTSEILKNTETVFAVVVSYPNTLGEILDYKPLADFAHAQGAFLVADVDLMALTLLTPPSEWGADIVIGNSQRFGVPLGYGGPHAAFLATKDDYKRLMPGRLVGVSVDTRGKKALRLALQTREQHIRREKATSNICTAQVLLANMASMYAVYHGPKGLKKIATKIHLLTKALAQTLKADGFKVVSQNYFDTVVVQFNAVSELSAVLQIAEAKRINFRPINGTTLGISFNETTDIKDLVDVLNCFKGTTITAVEKTLAQLPAQTSSLWPTQFVRTSAYLTHPNFNHYHSESEMLRYIHSLQNKDLTLTHSMIPLGSCTMKLNATTELVPVSWPEVSRMHPMAPSNQTLGYQEMAKDLEEKLCDLTGFAAVSLQPNAGSQGEFAGLLVIRKYFAERKEAHRNICLIPSSAHGTNPASAVMAGMKVIVVACDEMGNVDVNDLKAKAELHSANLACLMITYPSTHGVFEESITEICQIIHKNGGQVYMDGANLNALVGLCRPGQFGPDVAHMNLHKTFAIPHGGGGPGVGPIGVAAHLKDYVQTIGSVASAPLGSASILPISWSYISMMGSNGLKQATLVAILNANYIAKKLDPYYPVLYKGKEGLVAHECIIDLRPLKKTSGIDVADVAKRLMDYGFHAPTMSFPVAGTLMIEPTESESKAELDRFIEAMIQIRKEIDLVENKTYTLEDNPLVLAPFTADMALSSDWKHSFSRETALYPLPYLRQNKFWPVVGRIDNAYGDRNIMCSCPPVDAY